MRVGRHIKERYSSLPLHKLHEACIGQPRPASTATHQDHGGNPLHIMHPDTPHAESTAVMMGTSHSKWFQFSLCLASKALFLNLPLTALPRLPQSRHWASLPTAIFCFWHTISLCFSYFLSLMPQVRMLCTFHLNHPSPAPPSLCPCFWLLRELSWNPFVIMINSRLVLWSSCSRLIFLIRPWVP